mgnify:CR=1 FL=1
MAVQGTVRTETEGFSKQYGFGLFEILGVNLTNQQLKEQGFYVKDEDLEKDRVFLGEKEGVNTVRIEFALKEVKQEGPLLKKYSFFLEDKDRESQNTPGSFQWINNQGTTSYATSKENLADWFKEGKDVRKAKVGEAEFMEFMRNCMAVDFSKGGTLQYDVSKFFKGNVKELAGDLKSDYLSTIIINMTIKERDVVENEGDEPVKKEYENFYNKAFAPGSQWRFLQNKREFTETDIVKLHEKVERNKEIIAHNKANPTAKKKQEWLSPLEKIVVQMTDQQYPCKDRTYFGMHKEYVPGEDFISSDKVLSGNDDY